jgi:NTP pyrophosphatase (non-canonical NTP hydrolase)
MDLQQYTNDAIRTESVVDEFSVNSVLFKSALDAFIASGIILDQIKRSVYYGSDIDMAKVADAREDLFSSAAAIDTVEDLDPKNEQRETFNFDTRVLHALIGGMTEAGELAEALIKAIDTNSELDAVNLGEEFADINWYQAIACDALGLNWGNLLDANIRKLKTRYPEKFTSQDALNRDLDSERSELES